MIRKTEQNRAFQIPSSLSNDAADRLLKILAEESSPPTLRIPSKIKTRSLTAQPALLQAIITWGQLGSKRHLSTFLTQDRDLTLRTLDRNECLLTACLFATEIADAGGVDITLNIKALLPLVLKDKTDLPQKRSGQRVGTSRSIMAVDHMPRFAYPLSLYREGSTYDEEPFVIDDKVKPKYYLPGLENRTQEELDTIRLPLGFKACDMSQVASDPVINEAAVPLGEIIFELFQNTHVHARKRVDGTNLEKSVRMLHVRALEERRGDLLSVDPDDAELRSYLENVPALAPVNMNRGRLAESLLNDQLRFVVVSVLDCGPGIGPRESWTSGNQSNALSQVDDVAYIKAALAKRGTTLGRPLRGKGLQNVQALLSMLGGYARISTGTTKISRDFISRPFGRGDSEADRWVFENLVQASDGESDQIGTCGTAVTMVLPIYRLKALRSNA